jgi:hypothetical protein
MFRPASRVGISASRHHAPSISPRQYLHNPKLNAPSPRHYTPNRTQARPSIIGGLLAIASLVALERAGLFEWAKDHALSPDSFLPYKIASKEPVSATSTLFTLEPSSASDVEVQMNRELYEKAFRAGVWSVDFKQPHMQIARAYTPIPMRCFEGEGGWRRKFEDRGQARLWFLIRREREGEVSGYLHGLREGEEVEVRGPNVEWRVPERVRNVVFLAGGTGIAPAVQVAACLFEMRGRKEGLEGRRDVKLSILWANRRREDCRGAGGEADGEVATCEKGDLRDPGPVVGLLEMLRRQYPGEISVQYFVDEDRTFIDEKALGPLLGGKGGVGSGDENIVLVAGPDGFVDHYAGKKVGYSNGELQQGNVGGVLGKMNLEGWSVWKL